MWWFSARGQPRNSIGLAIGKGLGQMQTENDFANSTGSLPVGALDRWGVVDGLCKRRVQRHRRSGLKESKESESRATPNQRLSSTENRSKACGAPNSRRTEPGAGH